MWIESKKTLRKKLLMPVWGLAIIIGIPALLNLMFGDVEQFQSIRKFIDSISYGFSIGFVFWMGNWGLGKLSGRMLNWRKNPMRANMISLMSFMTFGIVASFIVPYLYLKYYIGVPVEHLLNITVGHAFISMAIDFIVISIYYSRYLTKYWSESIKNEEELKREGLAAKYEALKNQVNPHFLFNTLNTLTGVIEDTPEQATKFVRKFSGIYRYVLEQRYKELIPLIEEKQFIEDFIYLLKMRYDQGINIVYNFTSTNASIVPLGLQILIENAIKHNVISDKQPLTIEVGNTHEYIYVRNNYQPKNIQEAKSGVGLDNLIKRYEFLSNTPVVIEQTQEVFEVRLPLIKG